MATFEEDLYGNIDIIRQHESGSKPIKVCRPEGLGQEDNQEYHEDETYMNKDFNAGFYLMPSAAARHNNHESKIEQDQKYESLSVVANQGLQQQPTIRNLTDVRLDPEVNSNPKLLVNEKATEECQQSYKGRKHLEEESIELKVLSKGVAPGRPDVNGLQTQDESVSSKVPNVAIALGVIAIIIALAALVIVLLNGYKKINFADEKCECESLIRKFHDQLILLQRKMNRLQSEIYKNKSESSAVPWIGSSIRTSSSSPLHPFVSSTKMALATVYSSIIPASESFNSTVSSSIYKINQTTIP